MKEDRGASAKASVRSSAAAQPASRVDLIADILFDEFGLTVLHQHTPDVDDAIVNQHTEYRNELREAAKRIDAALFDTPGRTEAEGEAHND